MYTAPLLIDDEVTGIIQVARSLAERADLSHDVSGSCCSATASWYSSRPRGLAPRPDLTASARPRQPDSAGHRPERPRVDQRLDPRRSAGRGRYAWSPRSTRCSRTRPWEAVVHRPTALRRRRLARAAHAADDDPRQRPATAPRPDVARGGRRKRRWPTSPARHSACPAWSRSSRSSPEPSTARLARATRLRLDEMLRAVHRRLQLHKPETRRSQRIPGRPRHRS